MSMELDYSRRFYSGDAWRADFKDYFVEASELGFTEEDHFFWFSAAANTLVSVEVFALEPDEHSVCEENFTRTEPHVYVTTYQYAKNGELVKSWFEGKLLADISHHPELPFSQPIVRPSIRKGIQPKKKIPGEWAGANHGYQDVTVSLPVIDDKLVFLDGNQIAEFINKSAPVSNMNV